MTREEAKSCIGTIELLQRLAYNIHGVMDVIDANNCKKIIKALEQEPRKRTMQLVIDNKKQKEFAHEITKKFSFEELALFMYENSCKYCQKHNNCMGNATPQDCAKNIRQKFEKSYFETGDEVTE